MSALLLFLIRAYWRVVPVKRRRVCLFDETCSQHVYRQVRDRGVREGLGALRSRMRMCRNGYDIVADDALRIRAADGTLIPIHALNASLQSLCSWPKALEAELNCSRQ